VAVDEAVAARGSAPLGRPADRRVSSCSRRSAAASHATIAWAERRANSSSSIIALATFGASATNVAERGSVDLPRFPGHFSA
jgi:hypothetical protein